MSDGLHDIESRADCERLVRAFYGRALEDPIIGFTFVGIALAAAAPWALVMLAPATLLMHFGVILREERYLEALFGEEYLSYKRTTRRWI